MILLFDIIFYFFINLISYKIFKLLFLFLKIKKNLFPKIFYKLEME